MTARRGQWVSWETDFEGLMQALLDARREGRPEPEFCFVRTALPARSGCPADPGYAPEWAVPADRAATPAREAAAR